MSIRIFKFLEDFAIEIVEVKSGQQRTYSDHFKKTVAKLCKTHTHSEIAKFTSLFYRQIRRWDWRYNKGKTENGKKIRGAA